MPYLAQTLPFILLPAIAGAIAIACALVFSYLLYAFGSLWIPAYFAGARVSFASLIRMRLLGLDSRMIVQAMIMGQQAGLNMSATDGLTTTRLEAHSLAGGDVRRLILALIAASRAGIPLELDLASAIDLAGRDVLEAVRTSVLPKVIDCPERGAQERPALVAVARNGVELKVRARVTVRTNLGQLIGGATEQTIIARVGQGIVSGIGSAESHMAVLETPNRISKALLQRGLDANTAFEIVSIDISDMDVGENIGARLAIAQAAADTQTANARAAARSANAQAYAQEMRGLLAEHQARLIAEEAQVALALAQSVRSLPPPRSTGRRSA